MHYFSTLFGKELVRTPLADSQRN